MHGIGCFLDKELESTSLPSQDATAHKEGRSAGLGKEGRSEEVEEDQSALPPRRAQQALEIDLETLSEEAMDELVSSMMRHSSLGDPDVDLLGLSSGEEDDDSIIERLGLNGLQAEQGTVDHRPERQEDAVKKQASSLHAREEL